MQFTPDPQLVGRLEWLAEVRELAAADSWQAAAQKLSRGLQRVHIDKGEKSAQDFIRSYMAELLEEENYLEAIAIALSRDVFEPRPVHVKRIFDALTKYDLLILCGSANLGKSFCAVAWLYMDWWRDHCNTSIKYVSVSDTNLRGNIWGKIQAFNELCLFPIEVRKDDPAMAMWAREGSQTMGFDALLLGSSTSARGKIKGFHPDPFRKERHPKFGSMQRIRILCEEAQHLMEGVKDDLNSPKKSVGPTHTMKIIMTMNLVDEGKWAVKMAEPPSGWSEEQIDDLYEWEGKDGFHVTRLDSAVFENCVQRKTVFGGGFPTPDSGKDMMSHGMEPTPEWFIYHRGWVPPGRSQEVIIPSAWFDLSIGDPVFSGAVTNFAGADLAFGEDKACLALGRYGMASGWIDGKGVTNKFPSREHMGEVELRTCVVIDNIVTLNSKDTNGLATEIKSWCLRTSVKPENLCLDRTGSGLGVWSLLTQYFGADVIGLNWAANPTTLKILADDRDGALMQVHDLASELYLTIRQWINPSMRAFFVNPIMPPDVRDKLRHQLTTRRFERPQQRIRIEKKADWGHRNNKKSPDEGDAAASATMVIRMRGLQLPAQVNETALARREAKQMATGTGGADQVSDVRVSLQGSPGVAGSLSWTIGSEAQWPPELQR